MTDILGDYLRAVRASLRTDEPTKDQIVRELGGHLDEKVRDLRREHPDMPEAEAHRRVLQEMGSPNDLALAYGGAQERPALVRASTGEVVLRFGRAVGRGTKAFLKGVAFTLAFLLVLAAVLGVWGYYELRPVVAQNATHPLYMHEQTCARVNCTTPLITQSFDVHPGAREVRVNVWSSFDAGSNGSVELTLRNATGDLVYQRTFEAPPGDLGGMSTTDQLRWDARPGPWTVTYRYDGFQGRLQISATAVGLPEGTLLPFF